MDVDRRARKLAAKRRAVKGVAVRLALERGLEGLTVEAISEAADISPRTFHNYFATKEDALTMELSWSPEELLALFGARPAGEPVLESLHATFLHVASELHGQREEAAAFQELYRRHPELIAERRPRQADELVRTLAGAVAARTGQDPATDFGPTLLVNAALAVMQAAVRFQWTAEQDRSVEELLSEGFDVLREGLRR
ncbi:TetR family transcriptional regulator [Streptomyces sp. NPDC049954]|uniref:TetR/AcrR family transcriptional regulator n=1 Tax=Streptomyces sp. NPDC049954 TaxID=3155779 RepID=UPI003432D382